MRGKQLAMLLVLGALAAAAFGNSGGGISCSQDSDCGSWNYGMNYQCNAHRDCVGGRWIACSSLYYCGLSCANGVCNNMFHVCDGDCQPLAGSCDPSTCGGETCTDEGACGGSICGDGTCDAGEDCSNCAQDCGTCSTSTSTTSSTTSATTTASTSTSATTSITTSTFLPPGNGPIQLQGSNMRER